MSPLLLPPRRRDGKRRSDGHGRLAAGSGPSTAPASRASRGGRRRRGSRPPSPRRTGAAPRGARAPRPRGGPGARRGPAPRAPPRAAGRRPLFAPWPRASPAATVGRPRRGRRKPSAQARLRLRVRARRRRILRRERRRRPRPGLRRASPPQHLDGGPYFPRPSPLARNGARVLGGHGRGLARGHRRQIKWRGFGAGLAARQPGGPAGNSSSTRARPRPAAPCPRRHTPR